MADLYEPDYGVAYYRSNDPIRNLKIRVKLTRVSSTSFVPKAEQGGQDDGNLELANVQREIQGMAGQDDGEEYTFSWQEKVFSKAEVEKYSDIKNCTTVLERDYHQGATLQKQTGRPTNRLFSYVENDSFTNDEELIQHMTTSPNETMTPLAENMAGMKHRRKGMNRPTHGEPSFVPKMNIVDPDPSEDKKKQNHLMSAPTETMYIMADLCPINRERVPEDDCVLCTIKVDTNGVMSIKPDFSKGNKTYRVESSGMGRELFNYSIENASSKLNRVEQERERKVIKELYARHADFRKGYLDQDFEQVPPDVLRVSVFGEILMAKSFECRDLFIKYFLDLPDGWYIQGVQPMGGVTHLCSTKPVGKDEVAHFSYPFQFDLAFKRDSINPDKSEMMPKWPMILLEVLSIDSWQRYRTEGYGYYTLPGTPGVSKIDINCWRPRGRSNVSEMRRFFIGGSPELEDPMYAGIPTTFEGNALSKYGFRTISTGTVTVRLNVIQQSRSFLQSASSKKKVGTVMDRIGQSAVQANLLSVLDAFTRAKKKMMAARDNLKHDFVETVRAADADT